jgi:hypothetical protein
VSLFKPEKSGSPSGLLAKYLFKHEENNLAGAVQSGQSASFTSQQIRAAATTMTSKTSLFQRTQSNSNQSRQT